MALLPPSVSRRDRLLRRALPAAVAAGVLAVGAVVALTRDDGAPRSALAPPVDRPERTIDPLSYRPRDDADLVRRATAGYSHVLFAKSPGGAPATAQRVARLRPLVEHAASRGDVDPDTLEAIVFLESGGRPDVVAGKDPANASGLTQILAETGQGLLGMRIDLDRSRRLTRRAHREARRGHPRAAARALAARRRADERFQPAAALAATVRYLRLAHVRFGRDDLAVVSYHMGIGNLRGVLAAYGDPHAAYVRLFFDSTPLRHSTAYGMLQRFGDDSSTYYWRVLAAAEIMRLYRSDRSALERVDALQTAKGSAEEVLHPRSRTTVLDAPSDVAEARRSGELATLPPDPPRLGFALDRRMGELAPRLGQSAALYRALRPEALRLARYMGATLRRLSGVPAPLTMTSAVRDRRYQRLLAGSNPEATEGYSLHTTGFAFDVRRSYASRGQAVALQFLLDRLQALNLIAWVREPAAIHIAASTDAAALPAS